MKIQHAFLSVLVIFTVMALAIGPKSYADDTSRLGQPVTRLEAYTTPSATSYYDDLEDHYEQDQLMRDYIDEGIR